MKTEPGHLNKIREGTDVKILHFVLSHAAFGELSKGYISLFLITIIVTSQQKLRLPKKKKKDS